MKRKEFLQTFSGMTVGAFLPASLLSGCSEETDRPTNPFDKPFDPSAPVTVTGIGPTRGGIGTKIVVSGSNFGNDKTKVKLWFNDKEALVIKVQENAIYGLVPKQPGDLSTITVESNGVKAVLESIQFQYFINSTVTTVAGVYGKRDNPPIDGTAPGTATFYRPAKLAVDMDGNVIVADDQCSKIRLLSTSEKKMTTVLGTVVPWSCTFNADYTIFFVMARNSGDRPILFYSLTKESNYTESRIYYDQKGNDGSYLFGNNNASGLCADDKYVYMLAEYGYSIVRVEIESGNVEKIGTIMTNSQYHHLTFCRKDKMIYMTVEQLGKVYRFSPYKDDGSLIDSISIDDENMKHIVGGNGGGDNLAVGVEGNGTDALIGRLCGLGADNDGNIYICDRFLHCVWKIDPKLNCTLFAGSGRKDSHGYRDGKPEEALFDNPYDLTATHDGLIYVADTVNYLVRCISIQ